MSNQNDWSAAPAPVERNQCDGCQAGIPVENGMHRMGKPDGYADLMACAADRYGAAPAVQGEPGVKWAPEEVANGNKGIRWVTDEGVHGRPTDHDCRVYLESNPNARGCHCPECTKLYAAPQPAEQQPAEPVAWPTHEFAIVIDRFYEGEGPSLAMWNGESYQFSDGDHDLYRGEDGSLDGYTAEWLTHRELERRLFCSQQIVKIPHWFSAPVTQEPVAFLCRECDEEGWSTYAVMPHEVPPAGEFLHVEPLYASPVAAPVAAPQPAEQQPVPDVAVLVEALEEAYGTLERAVSPADETPEAAIQSAMFVIDAALAAHRKQGGES